MILQCGNETTKPYLNNISYYKMIACTFMVDLIKDLTFTQEQNIKPLIDNYFDIIRV